MCRCAAQAMINLSMRRLDAVEGYGSNYKNGHELPYKNELKLNAESQMKLNNENLKRKNER